jgi:hypothetical protein
MLALLQKMVFEPIGRDKLAANQDCPCWEEASGSAILGNLDGVYLLLLRLLYRTAPYLLVYNMDY